MSGILGEFFSLLIGSEGGEKKDNLEKMARREPLSDYLPYNAFDEAECEYHNTDDTIGKIWECTPLTFATPNEIKVLEALFRIALPKKTVMQFLLYPDPDISNYIKGFMHGKTREGELTKRNIQEYANFLAEGTKGVKQLHGIPLRNFRLFVALKSKERIPQDDLAIIEEALSGAGLMPKRLHVTSFMVFLRRLFNEHVPQTPGLYDENKPIRKQAIFAETEIDTTAKSFIKIGNRYARCLTPKNLPKEVTTLDTNGLTGGIYGITDDTEQINTPFIWSMNIIFDDDLKSEINNKASLTMMQKSGGSFAAQIQKRSEEYAWAMGEMDNQRFVRIIPSLWIFGDTEEEARSATARARRIWEGKNYVMQEESIISKPMFIASLPFGLYPTNNNIKTLDRDFSVPTNVAVRLLPIQADFVGTQDNPVLSYVGRKGQVIGLDVFDERSNNHNFLVTAGSGAGKSFSLNYLLSNYYAANSMVRVVDLGYSYQKLARTVGGRFMDFGKDKVTINPFASHAKDEEDRKFDLIATTNIVAEMVYSASRRELEETEWTLLKDAVRWANAQDGGIYGIDHVCIYLNEFPKHADVELQDYHEANEVARRMAFNLRDFKSNGVYGSFFNGPTTFDISQDDFVVLELERLKPQAELFRVITMQVLNAITQDLYWSDRSSRRFILFEEAWSFFDSGNRIGSLIEEGYRRARKYFGSFGIVTQSYLDLLKFGQSGDVIRANAAYKFLMESEDYAEAASKNLLDYEGLALDLVCGIKNNKPRYSEMFLDTPFGKGPARLVVDKWTYWVNTSAGNEVRKYNELLDRGFEVVESLEMLTGKKSEDDIRREKAA